jgi:hypothetical protein
MRIRHAVAAVTATLLLGTGVAHADWCCHSYSYSYRPAPRPAPRRGPLHWSAGLHLAGLSANQKIDGEGVALGGVGGHLRYRTYRFGGELSLDAVGNDFLDGSVSRVMVPVQASALLYLVPQGFLNIYLLGGVQLAFTAVHWDLPNLQDDQVFTQVGAQAGIGAELNLGRHIVLTGDMRFFGLVRSDSGPAGSYYAGIDDETIVPKRMAGCRST